MYVDMINIWKSEKPLMILAPMEGVTESVFRRVVVHAGRPDLMFTEFTSLEQLYSHGCLALAQNFEYEEKEKPLVAQLWGYTPELFEIAGDLVVNLGFDGVDINMSCPSRKIMKKGGGGVLCDRPKHAVKIIQSLKKGVGGRLPISIKIRLGNRSNIVETWVKTLFDEGIDALTVHGRTVREMSKVPAKWEEIGKVVEIRDQMGVDTKIIGNGDVMSRGEAIEKVDKYGVDGVMIGRGIFSNPWLFGEDGDRPRSKKEKLELLKFHLDLWKETWDGIKNFERLKRFFKVYVSDFDGSIDLRDVLMQVPDIDSALFVVEKELVS